MSNSFEAAARYVVLASTTALLAAVIGRVLAGGVSVGAIVWALVCTTPLWGPLSWLMRRSRKAYAAFTLCVIPYLIAGLTEAIANPHWRGWAAFVICLSFMLFVSLIAYLRVTRPAATP